jgi:allantoicase
MEQLTAAAFSGLVDLASERVGGKALLASDEFFAEKENLLRPGRGVFIIDKYTDRGKWMDGWETRRKRAPGHDWCVIRLGIPGIIKGVDIDTNHFLGNNPAYASIDACAAADGTSIDQLSNLWKEVLTKSPTRPGSQNLFSISSNKRWTHVRLNIYPDGGVSRLRVYGEAAPDWSRVVKGQVVDLAAIENGGLVTAASDMFFGARENLIMPGRAKNMGDGWETKRRRGPGNDWAIIKLGRPGYVRKVEVDTNHFKGNYPDTCSLDVCYEPQKHVDTLTWPDVQWQELLARTRLQGDMQQSFEKELTDTGLATHIRLNIFPDGGVSRLRVWCTLEPEA